LAAHSTYDTRRATVWLVSLLSTHQKETFTNTIRKAQMLHTEIKPKYINPENEYWFYTSENWTISFGLRRPIEQSLITMIQTLTYHKRANLLRNEKHQQIQ